MPFSELVLRSVACSAPDSEGSVGLWEVDALSLSGWNGPAGLQSR